MPLIQTPLAVMNAALGEAGCDRLESFEDDNREGEFARDRYEAQVGTEITRYPWRFARTMELLGSPLFQADGTTIDAPLAKWSFKYLMPTNPYFLLIDGIFDVHDAPIQFDIYGRQIYTDADTRDADVVLDGRWRPPEEVWPPYFTTHMIHKLAAAAIRTLREDVAMAETQEGLAAVDLQGGRFYDAKARTSSRVHLGRLSRLRRSR